MITCGSKYDFKMALIRSFVMRSGRILSSIRVLPRLSADGQPKAGYQLSQCALVSTSVEDCPGLPGVLSADISSFAEGKYLTVTFDNSQQSQLISQWLRQNCHCPECIDPGSNQRKVLADKLLGSPKLKSAYTSDSRRLTCSNKSSHNLATDLAINRKHKP